MCSISPIKTFFSKNRLSILGFDSHDDQSKIMINYEKKIFNEILGDALFEHGDDLQS